MTRGIPKSGYPLPEIIAPTNTRCVVFHIPDDLGHIIAFWGAVGELGKWVNWEKEETKSGVLVANVWDAVIARAREDYIAEICGEPCEECEDCASCEEKEIANTWGFSDEIGSMGYTIEELEEMLQMAITKLEYRDGVLYARDGCCDWYKVGSTGVPVAVGGLIGVSDKPSDLWTLQDWADAGNPSLPSVGVLPHENPSYNTADSIRCAKASALATVFFGNLDLLKVAFISMAALSTVSPTAIAAALVAAGLTGGFALIAGIAGAIAVYVFATNIEDIVEEIEGWQADPDLFGDYLCTLVGAVYPGEEIIEIDVDQMIKYFLVAIGATQEHWIFGVARAFPIQWYKLTAQPLVAQQECGCEQYLPYGYTPPAGDGFSFAFKEFGRAAAHLASAQFWDNSTPYEAAYAVSRNGTLVGDSPQTAFTAISGGYYWTGLAAIFELSEVATIDAIEVNFSQPDGTGAGYAHESEFAYLRDSDDTWQGVGSFTGSNNVPAGYGGTQVERIESMPNITHFAVMLRSQATGAQRRLKIESVKITGSVGGVGFVDLLEGDIFNP